MTSGFRINRLALIGVGLVGGSLSLALRHAGCVGSVTGYCRSPGNRDSALKLGILDRVADTAAAAVEDADLVVVATPVRAIAEVLQAIGATLSDSAIVTDVGSVKGSIVKDCAVLESAAARFVPGHPIAGTERSGPAAAHGTLFQGRRVVLTPTETTAPAALTMVSQMWEATGAVVSVMAADQHDRIFAATSHLPHALAYVLVEMLASGNGERLKYTAGGFQDFTRIASSDPELWRDICLDNSVALLEQLDTYRGRLAVLAEMIRKGDGNGLLKLFRQAKQARDAIVGSPSDSGDD